MQEDLKDKIIKEFKKIGFLYISVDLQGYRPEALVNKKNNLKP